MFYWNITYVSHPYCHASSPCVCTCILAKMLSQFMSCVMCPQTTTEVERAPTQPPSPTTRAPNPAPAPTTAPTAAPAAHQVGLHCRHTPALRLSSTCWVLIYSMISRVVGNLSTPSQDYTLHTSQTMTGQWLYLMSSWIKMFIIIIIYDEHYVWGIHANCTVSTSAWTWV